VNGVRWSKSDGRFEGRCDACCDWWPLDAETRDVFWPVDGRGLRICRACDRLKTHARTALLRTDPSYRERERGYSAAYYESLSPSERRALRRAQPGVVDRQRAWTKKSARKARARVKGLAEPDGPR
jgi:hypothetical protein